MAFTRVVGAGIHTAANINSHNIKSTGIITATKFDGPFDTLNVTGDVDFLGNVSIGGTLTYEDVTNIDSVGLVTARDGIFVPNNKEIKLGGSDASPAFRIFSNGTHQYIRDVGSGNLFVTTNSLNVLNSLTNQTLLKATQGATGYVQLYQNNQVKLETTSTGAVVTGILTATNGLDAIGIQSGGINISTGIITAINFIGLGNTFAVNGTTVDVSISGNAGAGGTWSSYTAGIATSKSVGVNTNNLDDNDLVGVGNSFQGLYISNGMMITDNKLSGNHYIGTAFNGLMAGPVNIEGTLTVDGNYVVV